MKVVEQGRLLFELALVLVGAAQEITPHVAEIRNRVSNLSICLSVYLSICLIYLTIYLSVHYMHQVEWCFLVMMGRISELHNQRLEGRVDDLKTKIHYHIKANKVFY